METVQVIETTHSATIGKVFESLAKAQGKIESALKDKKNPFFKSSYADLASVWDACRGPLSENGLAVIQTVEGTKTEMFLITWLGHSSGEWIKSKLPLMVMKADPQSLGSAITYARRYALSAMVGVCADEDDDGEKAMGRKAKSEKAISMEEVTQTPTQQELNEKLSQFLSEFPREEQEYISAYLHKYAGHYKKTLIDAIDDYSDLEKFKADYQKWRIKELAKHVTSKTA